MCGIRGRVLLKVPLIGLGLVALCLGAMPRADGCGPGDLAPAGLAMGSWFGHGDRRRRSPAAPRPAADEPPFSDITFDDSGYATAIRFSKPIADPASLAQIRDSVVGRGRAGDRLPGGQARQPAARRSGDPVHHGEHPPPDRLAADVRRPMGRGRRRSSPWRRPPIRPARHWPGPTWTPCAGSPPCGAGRSRTAWPVATSRAASSRSRPSAVHRRTAGSREAIEHFTRYLRQRPEDLGVQLALERRLHDAGRVPRRRPARVPPAAGPVRRGRETDPRRMVNVASRVGLNARGESMAGGCLVDDFDGDGLLDVFMPTTDPERGALLLRNRGDGTVRGRLRRGGPGRPGPVAQRLSTPTSTTTASSTS